MTARIAAIVLAAGMSRRWGPDNKLLAPVDGTPMIVRTLSSLLASSVRPVIVVLGHEADTVRPLIASLDVTIVTATGFADGMSESLKTGIAAVPPDCDGALICLGDMPWIKPATFERIAASFDPRLSVRAIIPAFLQRQGNPVLIGRALFPDVAALTGDKGAKALFRDIPQWIGEVPVEDRGILVDADNPDMLAVEAH